MTITATDMHANAHAAGFGDRTIESICSLRDIFSIVGAKAEKRFVTLTKKGKYVVLALHSICAHPQILL